MTEIELLQRALQREKRARKQAETILENRSRELYLSNISLQEQNELLEQKNTETQLFFDVTSIGNCPFNTGECLQQFIKIVCEKCDLDIGHIYEVINDNNNIKFISAPLWHIQSDYPLQPFIDATDNLIFKQNEGLPGRIYNSQKAQLFPGFFIDNTSARSAEGNKAGFDIVFGIPIYRYNGIIAIAEFFSRYDEKMNEELLNTINLTAQQLKTVLERRYSEKNLAENYTELKNAHEELKSTQSQLLQSSKLASLGQLAAGVAHEINNPVAYIRNNINVLKDYLENIKLILTQHNQLLDAIEPHHDLASQKKDIETSYEELKIDYIMNDLDDLIHDSLEGISRVVEIVSDLKSFSRVDEAEVTEGDINKAIESTIKIIWNELKYKCTLEKEYGELPLLRCYLSQLNQVFMNLLVNASQAIEHQGKINIKTLLEENNIIIEISDNGSGIPSENLEKLFDPFFTTKPVGVGTGLGLYISYGIVQKHHGTLEVKSELGKGTTFKICLPISGVEIDMPS